MSEVIRLENVVCMTPDNWRAVNGISLCIGEQEHVMLCADSGISSDALMRIIAGVEKPSSGEVFVLSQAVHAMSSGEAAVFRNRHIGAVLEEPGFIDKLSIAENISLPLIIRGINRHRSREAAEDLLNTLGIRHVANALPAQLSVYETRAAGIARALITKPKILLLNEVTARLSVRDSEKITETLSVIGEYGGCTALWIGNIANEAIHANRTIRLENGKIREDRK